jgi:Sec7-like guanine-nucleotide exchange factor
MSASDFEVLRACYVSQLNFTGMSFDRALRYFLCDANFLLPGEGQKVDRLMMAFRFVSARACFRR